ncbi:hypothetical protein Amsp01_097650 [Amycolatopsis sp. NBRC 101858]|uniref:DUF6801 domain-containing protein n=1 Tax=Amycolatopsis sp. NBRC 101858 TaxID=3032200 RepID=UPI0024A43A18|nr:DUF6801 domain-containing protein [Amycolatopsis sp. NBRC 101858]GLY43742.1 hypothetical protein Amsp01_097650 [Amycolatopsis sp. NBRC 101858]
MFRRLLILVPAAVAALVAVAGPAAALTTYNAGPVGYRCTFPGISAQATPVTETFDGPSTVAPGATFTITGISGSLALSTATRSLLIAIGYDSVRGSGAIPVTATNATPAGGTGGTVPTTTWGMPATIPFFGASQSFVAGAAGTITFSTGSPASFALQFHKASNNTWTNWTMACTLSAGQIGTFSPTLPIL